MQNNPGTFNQQYQQQIQHMIWPEVDSNFPISQSQQLQPDPVELSDDNAPKNPMAGRTLVEVKQCHQPKLNLSSQSGTSNLEPSPAGQNHDVPFQQKGNSKLATWHTLKQKLQYQHTLNNQRKKSLNQARAEKAKQRILENMKKKGLITDDIPPPSVSDDFSTIPSVPVQHQYIIPNHIPDSTPAQNASNNITPISTQWVSNQVPEGNQTTNLRRVHPEKNNYPLIPAHPKGIPRSFLVQKPPEIAAQFNIQPIVLPGPRAHIPLQNQFYQDVIVSTLMTRNVQMVQSNEQILAQNTPIMMQTNMPMLAQNNVPIMMQPHTPLMAQPNTPMLPQINMPIHDKIAPVFENPPILDQTPRVTRQTYSPTEMFNEFVDHREKCDGSASPDTNESGQKRLSAFKRLGPMAETKKPKLTINLSFGNEQAVREVVDETNVDVYTPVHLRQDVRSSTDSTVRKYLPLWPWKKIVSIKKSVSFRNSKSAMLLEREQMQNEVYDKSYTFVQITLTNYPSNWTKEQVLDLMLDSVRGKSFIPCFIDFKKNECRFLVIRCRSALLAIHKYEFVVREDNVEMAVTISQVNLTVDDVGLVPSSALKQKLAEAYDGERKLNLSAFTAGSDISHFIYFPLHRVTNQVELIELKSDVIWDYITDLDLSHNRITTVQGFDLPVTMPKLKRLNLSYNYIEKVSSLLKCRDLSLTSIWLEGNPLCHDYIDPAEYVKVIRMIFPTVSDIDGTRIQRKGEFPAFIKNYCPEDAMSLVEKFLEVFFPLLDAEIDQRPLIQELYDTDAVLTITYKHKLRINPMYRYFNNLFLKSRVLEERLLEAVEGSVAISKLITKWPNCKHDPCTFTIDVTYHSDTTTVLRVDGIMKLTAESLAEDEQLIGFTRTVVLHTNGGAQYKIKNEMVYWSEPNKEIGRLAFQVTTNKTRPLSLKLETVPDDDLKAKLLDVFMKLTEIKRKPSERCLEMNEWNLKHALEYFSRLLKLDNLDVLN